MKAAKPARAALRASPPVEVAAPPRATAGAIADAVGHCLLVFTFVPPLAALPTWLWREATNVFNREDAVVLMFLPVRGVNVFLNAFYAGVLPGVLSGLAAGIALAAWDRMAPVDEGGARLGRATPPRVVGALAGAVGAAVSVLATVAIGALRRGTWSLPLTAVAFEVGAGLVCGALAGPSALRLLRAARTTSAEGGWPKI